ncbi:MAG: aminotransferase class I/II-fold pyridoxal phosphate-dependent enzyme [Deltaproteobacteria bacterium]|nr:aminotransferase class I/II-fold pyridoxal phosphate-dependent enzyme [Deltaproteobacteria bacterium]MBW2398614.1 aminotransferase class I/II-fold pyridoxal phosphate-dependent enzyme [Deltaproteobacteria bacterium]MBW2664834.1 aminotransferase class I/II-fold pyridoxal phosphate-dependent enzyme [Deltaproteobacteria bacterium]
MGKKPDRNGDSTRSVHAGERDHHFANSVTTPIFQTSTFWFKDSAELCAFQEGRLEREEYGRYGNPTWAAVERKLCELEGGESAVLFASGMCAATTLFLALLPKGAHLIVTGDCYRRTRQFIRDYLVKLDVETTVIEPADTKALAAAIRDDTALFFTESPTNPYLRVIDIEETVRVCHARGVKVVIDSTFASPVSQRALDGGADYVIHSATKFLGGHNDLLAGCAIGSAEAIAPVREAVGVLGGVIDPHAAYLLLRGLKTLSLRVERHNANALRMARWLEEQDAVRRVWYPGLESHPDHSTAAKLMRGFGGVVTFELETDLEGAMRFVDACRIPYIAPSLGGVESLIEMPVTMSFWDVPREERMKMGITDSLIRYACGIEDCDDLIADLEQALRAI